MEQVLRILHLEDDPLDTELVAGLFRKEGLAVEIDRVDTREGVQRALTCGGYTLILSDYAMPQLDPMEALRLARHWRPDLPFVFLSGTMGEEQAVDTLKRGATDYVLKQRIERLVPVVRRALREAEEFRLRKRAEEERRSAGELLSGILEGTADLVAALDHDFRYLAFNRSYREDFRQVFGREIDVGTSMVEALAHLPDEQQSAMELWARALRGESFSITCWFGDPYRQRKVYDLRFSPIRDTQGQVIGAAHIVSDATQRQQAEDALRTGEQRLQATFEHAGVGIVELEDDRLIAVNSRACEILDRTHEQLLTSSVHELTWPEDRALSDRMNSELHAGLRDRIDYEKRYLRGDGSPVWVHVTVSRFRDRQRNFLGWIKTIEDISDRKRAEQELEAARQAAEQANRAKDHFLAVLSHELRTPLTPVIMGVSMLQDEPDLKPHVHETLEMVRRNAEMEARLIDDLLDVTRIERGKLELNQNPVALCTIIRRAVEVCEPDIEVRRLHFGVDWGPAPYWVEADVSRLQQVFWNLLKNAIKFTPPGGCIGIRCRRDEAHVVVEVNDSGIGIEPEALERVFTAFEQAERSITRQFGGLGLGLAISRALVKMHGGTVQAHSEGRNRGATFCVRLPLCAPVQQVEPTLCKSSQHPVPSLRILLVEDHGVTAEMMKMVLNSQGHAVDVAGDVATALRLADRYAFDLLLSDLGLPDGSGHDLMQELRARGHTFPGIALSGYGQEDDISRSYDAGFAAHLTKPASREAVVDAVASVTSCGRSGPAGQG